MVDREFDNVLVTFDRSGTSLDIEAVGVAEPVKHAASGIFGEAVVGVAAKRSQDEVCRVPCGTWISKCRCHRICFQIFRYATVPPSEM